MVAVAVGEEKETQATEKTAQDNSQVAAAIDATSWSWPGHTGTLSPAATTLTYLEINGWLLSAGGVNVLCDPVLEGPLDFGIPDIYSASKRVLPPTGLIDTLPPL